MVTGKFIFKMTRLASLKFATKKRLERDSLGLCLHCGGQRDNKTKLCNSCLEKHKLDVTNRRLERIKNGKCKCGKILVVGKAQCNECLEKLKQYHTKTRNERNALYHKPKRMELKLEIWSAYGGPICKCCGEERVEFLSIDHINGGGNQHRKEITGFKQGNIYRWLKKNNFPEGFQVLCFNCNMSIGFYGYCPHEVEL
jgi:hypothetical protein